MKVSLKRKIMFKMKEIISSVVLFFLYRGFKVAYKVDTNCKIEIDSWEENFSVKLNVAKGSASLCIVKENGQLVRKDDIENPSIEITFKSIDAAFLVLTGRLGVAGAYAEHRFNLQGDISRAMSFVRCIDIVEAYLFPKFIVSNILKEVPKKQANMLQTYSRVILDF